MRPPITFFGLVVTLAGSAAAQSPPTVMFVTDADTGEIHQTITLLQYPRIFSPEISPDGNRVGVDGWGRNQRSVEAHVLIVNLDDGEVTDLGPGCMPSWSADGQWVACCRYGQGVFILSVDGTRERLIDGSGWAPQWSPDGTRLAYVRGGNLVIYDLAAEEGRELFAEGVSPYRNISHNCKWSPDSERICFLGYRTNGTPEFAIVTVTGDDPQLNARCAADEYNPDIAWHPEGDLVLIPRRGRPGQIYAFDPDGTDPPTRYPKQPGDRSNGGMCFSRDGRLLIFMSNG
jgi:Tol biopolymer transport system component